MELKLSKPNNDVDGTYSTKVIAIGDDIEDLFKLGIEKAVALGEDLPMWLEGSAVDAIVGSSSSHFMLLANDVYLSIS